MPTGRERHCRHSLNGSALLWITRSKEILSRTKIFIRAHCLSQATIDVCTECLAIFGNGRAAPTRPTLAIAPRRVHLANTMASSCATNTFCVSVRVQPHAHIFAALIAFSFNHHNAPSLPESDARATHK